MLVSETICLRNQADPDSWICLNLGQSQTCEDVCPDLGSLGGYRSHGYHRPNRCLCCCSFPGHDHGPGRSVWSDLVDQSVSCRFPWR